MKLKLCAQVSDLAYYDDHLALKFRILIPRVCEDIPFDVTRSRVFDDELRDVFFDGLPRFPLECNCFDPFIRMCFIPT